MCDHVNFHFEIDGENFTSAGEASVRIKKNLREMGFSPEVIRRVSVAMYEGEINMVIHANGGTADVNIYCDRIEIILADKGPGISDIELAMQAYRASGACISRRQSRPTFPPGEG